MNVFLSKPFLIGISLFALGSIAGWSTHVFFTPKTSSTTGALRQSDLTPDNTYRFIDPLLGLKHADPAPTSPYVSLQESLQTLIDNSTKEGSLVAASIVFRDINASEGLTINPNEQYSPASLLKVPLMMAYFKSAELKPAILSKSLIYAGTHDANTQEHFSSSVQLTKGSSYSIEELIEHLIKYSDNNAAELLATYLNSSPEGDIYATLFGDLGITEIDLTNDFITIGAYSLFFRVLYNATYLNRDMSEKAMEILTKTDFMSGLAAGFAGPSALAHKFGEFSLETQSGQVLKRELHDCGYIYYPSRTYFLCVMTKGKDFDKLKNIIVHISRQVSDFIKK